LFLLLLFCFIVLESEMPFEIANTNFEVRAAKACQKETVRTRICMLLPDLEDRN